LSKARGGRRGREGSLSPSRGSLRGENNNNYYPDLAFTKIFHTKPGKGFRLHRGYRSLIRGSQSRIHLVDTVRGGGAARVLSVSTLEADAWPGHRAVGVTDMLNTCLKEWRPLHLGGAPEIKVIKDWLAAQCWWRLYGCRCRESSFYP